MTTDTPQNSSDHDSKDVPSATAEKAPLKGTETKSAVADGKSIGSAAPTPEETAKSEGDNTKKELEDDEDAENDEDDEDNEDDEGNKDDEDNEDEEDNEDDEGDEDNEEEEMDADAEDEEPEEFEWGRPRGRITTPITGGKVKK